MSGYLPQNVEVKTVFSPCKVLTRSWRGTDRIGESVETQPGSLILSLGVKESAAGCRAGVSGISVSSFRRWGPLMSGISVSLFRRWGSQMPELAGRAAEQIDAEGSTL